MKELHIHPDDNVAILLEGSRAGHKVAVRPIFKGEPVLKYGYPIGVATQDIAAGEWVHTHNLRTRLSGEMEYRYEPGEPGKPVKPDRHDKPNTPVADSFLGYRRADGSVGIRNEIWIIPTVACVNSLCLRLATSFQSTLAVRVLSHPYGCSQLAQDAERTGEVLAALARHPNAGGVLVVGLGCENNTLDSMRERLAGFRGHPIAFLCAQEAGDEIADGLRLLSGLADAATLSVREPIPVSELIVGLKCGGSDGLSGLSANPVIGEVSDRIARQGGTTVLTEIPELFGAEPLLLNRCLDVDVFNRAAALLNEFKRYYLNHNLPVYENPSPGNKEGGISTLEEKSLGCVHKSGHAAVVDVLDYAQRVHKRGVNILWGPGNDPVACTALAASGCHLLLFSTGRGTPYGTVVPTVKISSNTSLAKRKSGWIDFDAGGVATGEESLSDAAGRLYAQVLRIANGSETRNERNDATEIAIFKDGVTL